jgi:hypothetical protein
LTLPTDKSGGFSLQHQLLALGESYTGSMSVLCVGLPGRHEVQSFGKDIFGCVFITVDARSASFARPFAVGEREVRFDRATDSMQLAGGEESPDNRDEFSAPDRLIFDLSAKLAEGRVEDAFAQLGFRQALNTQILDADQVVPRDQCGRGLVEKVAPLACCLAMNAGDSKLRFSAARATFLSPGEYALDFPQHPFSFTEELRDGNIGRIARERGKGLEAKIDANRIYGERNLGIINFALGNKRDEPIAAGIAFERSALGRHGNGLRKTQANPTDLRAINPLAINLDPLGNTESIALLALFLELWEPGSLLEEVRERSIQVAQGLLQRLRVNLAQPTRILSILKSRQFKILRMIPKRLAMLDVMRSPASQAPIPNESSCSSQTRKTALLFGCWLQLETINELRRHRFFWFSMYCLTIANGAPPTVEQNQLFVQSVGNRRFSLGNSVRNT